MVYRLGVRARRVKKTKPLSSWLAVIAATAVMLTTAVSAENWLSAKINPWWPLAGVSVSGQQPIKADVPGYTVESYNMYWSVDGGNLNFMATNYTDYPHKETVIDYNTWTWRGMGPYELTYHAVDLAGTEIARTTVKIYVDHPAPSSTAPAASARPGKKTQSTVSTPAPAPAPAPAPVEAPAPATSITAATDFYVAPDSNPIRQAAAWKDSRPQDAAIMEKMAERPVAKWFGDWNKQIELETRSYVSAAKQQSATPVLVAYNIPGRDCGSYSAGGSHSADAYRSWIQGLARGIGTDPALVILEPDGLAHMDCLSSADKTNRLQLLAEAVSTLKKQPAAKVYLDAGNPRWISSDEIVNRLSAANVRQADGFSLNVSNFFNNEENTIFGEGLSRKLNGKHFVIDTSRNGLGPTSDQQWCNPSGRALGSSPTATTNNPLVDAYLWIKAPGESDGTCNGGPSAGVWWPEYALDLAKKAGL